MCTLVLEALAVLQVYPLVLVTAVRAKNLRLLNSLEVERDVGEKQPYAAHCHYDNGTVVLSIARNGRSITNRAEDVAHIAIEKQMLVWSSVM